MHWNVSQATHERRSRRKLQLIFDLPDRESEGKSESFSNFQHIFLSPPFAIWGGNQMQFTQRTGNGEGENGHFCGHRSPMFCEETEPRPNWRIEIWSKENKREETKASFIFPRFSDPPIAGSLGSPNLCTITNHNQEEAYIAKWRAREEGDRKYAQLRLSDHQIYENLKYVFFSAISRS